MCSEKCAANRLATTQSCGIIHFVTLIQVVENVLLGLFTVELFLKVVAQSE